MESGLYLEYTLDPLKAIRKHTGGCEVKKKRARWKGGEKNLK